MEVAGNIIMIIGAVFMCFGVIGMIKFKNFFTRVLVAAKIDTVGLLTVIIGMIVKHGFGFFSLKLVLLAAILLVLNPLTNHIVASSAYKSGYKPENLTETDGGDVPPPEDAA